MASDHFAPMSAPSEPDGRDTEHGRAQRVRARVAPAEERALGTLAIVAALALLWVLAPVGLGVLLGTLLAFTTYGPYRSLARRTRKPVLAAALITSAAAVTVAGSIGMLGYLIVMQGVAVSASLPHALDAGGAVPLFFTKLAGPLAIIKLRPAELSHKVQDALGSIGASFAGWAAQMVGMFFDGLLALFFMAFTMAFVLLHWAELARRAENLLPFNPHHTRRLMRETRRLGHAVVMGNFGTGIVQGATAAVGFWIAHLPQPAFWGLITAAASLIPAFGTILIWVPAGFVLIAQGHSTAGIFELLWGAFVVAAFCDYFVRPKLVGGGRSMSTWLSFVSLFGGIKLFGFAGLLLGPLIAGMAVAALRIYERARRFRLRRS